MRVSADRGIEKLAASQHGVVTRHQLLSAGLDRGAVARRVRAGRLRRVHRGVYQVGPVPAARSREMAAVLACGPTAAISYSSGARMHQIPVPGRKSDPVDVSVPAHVARFRPGVCVHRVQSLGETDVTRVQGIPVTTPVRTLVDLAAVLAARDLERAVSFALREQDMDRASLEACARRLQPRAGIPLLLKLLSSEGGPAFIRSEAEARFLDLIRGSGIPTPKTNVRVCGSEVDFYWPKERVILEVDGYQYHKTRARYHGDRARDRGYAAEGFVVIRVTWEDLVGGGSSVLVSLACALTRRAMSPAS